MKNKFFLTPNQGTTSSKVIVFNYDRQITSIPQKPYEQIFPKPEWVEHNPNEIWSSQIGAATEVIAKAGIAGKEIAATGIPNQCETTIVWDRETGEPLYNAIVWQDCRTAKYCDELKTQGLSDMIQRKTRLLSDAYLLT